LGFGDDRPEGAEKQKEGDQNENIKTPGKGRWGEKNNGRRQFPIFTGEKKQVAGPVSGKCVQGRNTKKGEQIQKASTWGKNTKTTGAWAMKTAPGQKILEKQLFASLQN